MRLSIKIKIGQVDYEIILYHNFMQFMDLSDPVTKLYINPFM